MSIVETREFLQFPAGRQFESDAMSPAEGLYKKYFVTLEFIL